MCTGIKPNTKDLVCCPTSIENQYMCVDDYLRVRDMKNTFAAGDITNIKEEKTAQGAEVQAEVVVRNIYNGEANQDLVKYHAEKRAMVISLGKWDGVLIYKKFVLTGILPAILKILIEKKTMRQKK